MLRQIILFGMLKISFLVTGMHPQQRVVDQNIDSRQSAQAIEETGGRPGRRKLFGTFHAVVERRNASPRVGNTDHIVAAAAPSEHSSPESGDVLARSHESSSRSPSGAGVGAAKTGMCV